jgi:vacuolar-type H+-ATPase subunit I/STV1
MKLESGDEALLEISGFGQKALDEVKAAIDGYTLVVAEVEEEVDESEESKEIDSIDESEEVTEAEIEEESTEVEEELPAAEKELDEIEDVVEELDEELIAEEKTPSIDDLGVSLVQVKPEKKKEKKKVVIVQAAPAEGVEAEDKDRTKSTELVFDEQQGRVVAKRKRKSGRLRPQWEDYEGMEADEVLEDEI